MKVFSAQQFVLPLPEGHRFPMRKYALLHERVAADPTGRLDLRVAPRARDAVLRLAHDADYLARVESGRLSAAELRALGFPWSPALVERSRRSVGATLAACSAALAEGAGASLAGGTHHAARDHGAGFCVFNDVAVAALWLLDSGRCERVAIIDCDVHQGDGTAQILAGQAGAYTFSIHGARNYPLRKAASDRDVALADGAGDAEYCDVLGAELARLATGFRPQFILYIAGADPFEQDRYGRLALSRAGLARRDRLVCEWARGLQAPLAMVMGGGYAADVEAVADIHLHSVLAAASLAAVREPGPGSLPASR